MRAPADTHDWIGLTDAPLPVAEAHVWAVRPECGAVVVFTGTVRSHADGRAGVTSLEYEAYEAQAVPAMQAIAAAARERWGDVGRIALLHRVGLLELTEAAVVVAVSAPHREHAFEAARWCIDTLKATVPIWKRETWDGGTDWGTCAHDLTPLEDVIASTEVVG